MILQPISFPNTKICDKKDLYLKYNKKVDYKMDDKTIHFEKGGIVRFNTYFNSFSLNKWKSYTNLESLLIRLHAHGRFVINVKKAYINKENNLAEDHLFSDYFEDEYECPPIDVQTGGVIYFTLECISDEGEFLSGAYETEIDESLLNDVKICMGVCTFRDRKSVV